MKIALINFHSLALDNPWIKEKAISINYLKLSLRLGQEILEVNIGVNQNTVLTSILQITHLSVQGLDFSSLFLMIRLKTPKVSSTHRRI